MRRDVRGLGRQIRRAALWAACAALIPTLSACAPAAGGAVLVGIVGIGALTTHCYDYLDVTVFDAQGRKTCAATVTARNGGDHFELSSCYYAPLTDGVWALSASLPGYPDTTTTVPVEHANDCTRHVQSVELSLKAPGNASRCFAARATSTPAFTNAAAPNRTSARYSANPECSARGSTCQLRCNSSGCLSGNKVVRVSTSACGRSAR